MKCSIIFTIIWLTLIQIIDARVIRVKGPQRSNKRFHHLCNVAKDGSHIPYPNDCSKFIHCDTFHAFIKQCPEGTLFDNNIKICNYEHLVICPYISKESEINTGGRQNDILDEETRGFSGKPIINNINDITPKSTIKPKIEEFQDDSNDYDSAEEDTNVQVNDFIKNKESSGRSDVIQNEVTDTNEIEYEANTTTTKTTKNIKEMETIDTTSTPTDITTEPINTTSIDAINKPIDTVTTVFIDTTTDLDDPTFIETKTNPIDTTSKSIHTTKTVLMDSTTEPNDITTEEIDIATNELSDTRFEPNNTTTTLILDTTTQSIDTTTSKLINATTTEPVDIAFESVDTNTDIESMTTTEPVIISGDEITEMTQDPTEYIDDISEPDHSTNEPINTTFESLAINTDIEYMTTIEPVIISGDEVSEMVKDQTEYIDDVSEPNHSINQPITTTFESVAINTDIESMTTTEPVIISGNEVVEMGQDSKEFIDYISELVDSTKEPIVTTTEQFVTTTEHIDTTNYLIESETNINAESENEYFGAAIELIDNTFNFEPTEPQTSTEIEPVDGIAEIMLPEIMSEMISTKIFNFIKENKQKALNDVIVHIDEDDYLLEPEVQIVQVDENAIKATVKVPNDMTGSLKFHVEVKELNKKQNQVLFVKALTDIVSRQLNQTLLPNDTIKLSISSVDEQSKTTEDSVLSWILDPKKKDNDVYNDYVDKSLDYKKHEIPLPYVRTEKLSWNWEK